MLWPAEDNFFVRDVDAEMEQVCKCTMCVCVRIRVQCVCARFVHACAVVCVRACTIQRYATKLSALSTFLHS